MKNDLARVRKTIILLFMLIVLALAFDKMYQRKQPLPIDQNQEKPNSYNLLDKL